MVFNSIDITVLTMMMMLKMTLTKVLE